jgi:hypothetical protein
MAGIVYKWLLIVMFAAAGGGSIMHPYYVSVTEIEHNAKTKALEVSCKITTDDFENTLRQQYKTNVDLLKPKDKAAMDKLVNDYMQKHLAIQVNGKAVTLQFLGYEQIEEGIISYYEAANVTTVNNIAVTNNLLYEYKKEQIGIIHITVDGNRKSSRLNNPKDKVSFEF